jgi:uncharacterized RDD family membrane protein YckC
MNWYYAIGQQRQGPVTEQQLQALAKDGVLTGDTLVWRECMTGWQAWRTVGGPAMPPVPAAATAVTATTQTAQAIRPATAEFEYAGFWIRFCAKLIDGIVLGIPLGIVSAIVLTAMGGLAVIQRGGEASVLFFLAVLGLDLLGMALSVLYNTLLIGCWGATLGKKVCGLKVVRPDGARVGYGRACGRAFAEIVSRMVCYIGYIIAGFDDQKRALHDHMCETRVVKAR